MTAVKIRLFYLQKPQKAPGFYYLAAALKTAGSVQGTNGILIGDRIAPQLLNSATEKL